MLFRYGESESLPKEAMVSGASLIQQEGILRRVNEAIERGFWPGERDRVVRMRCECGRIGCNTFVTMRVGDYEQIRSHPRWFVLCGGHQTTAIEKTVGCHAGYVVVEKTGPAGRAADRSDPRSRWPDQDPTP